MTDEYFYAPWSVLVQDEINELYELLIELRGDLNNCRKSKILGDNHI
jgi:hypothetical protein